MFHKYIQVEKLQNSVYKQVHLLLYQPHNHIIHTVSTYAYFIRCVYPRPLSINEINDINSIIMTTYIQHVPPRTLFTCWAIKNKKMNNMIKLGIMYQLR